MPDISSSEELPIQSTATLSTAPINANTEQPTSRTGSDSSDTVLAVVIVLIMTVIVATMVVIAVVLCSRRVGAKAKFSEQGMQINSQGFGKHYNTS